MATHLTDDRLQHGDAIEPIIFVALRLRRVDHREGIEAGTRAHRELDECATLQLAAMLEAAAVIDHDDLRAGADQRRGDFLQGHGLARAGLAEDRDIMVAGAVLERSEEHTSELQSLMRISYAVFCLKKK